MKVANKITTLLCDDVREETGGKFSLMGIYTKDMIFPQFPALLPKICLCIMLDNVKTDFGTCNVTFHNPQQESVSLKLEIPEKQVGRTISLFAIYIPFRVVSAGDAKFEVRFGTNKKPSAIHRFKIHKA